MSDFEVTATDGDVPVTKNGSHTLDTDKIAVLKEANKVSNDKVDSMEVDQTEEPKEKLNGSAPKKSPLKEQPVTNGDSADDEDLDDEMDDVDSKDSDSAKIANGSNHKTDGETSQTATDDESIQGTLSESHRSSPRKSTANSNASNRELSSSEENFDGVENEDSSDSIMELEAEDPLAGPVETFESEKRKSNIVTIDDPKTLLSLANNSKKPEEKPSVMVIDTNTILAGKATSGVTITPAKPRVLPLGGASFGSGVTISHTGGKHMSRGVGLPMGTTMTSLSSSGNTGFGSLHAAASNSGFTYDKQGQLNDPNLTDDTFVVEAPSFIVPYVYEKPPKESFTEFKESVEKMKKDGEKDDKEEEAKKKDEEEKDNDKSSESSTPVPEIKKTSGPSDSYFESQLGKFMSNLGMNLVQEYVQQDLLRDQTRRSQKDKSASVMHAIMSLKKNLETSKDKNEGFHFESKKCRLCSHKSESILVQEHHLETPHFRNGLYRCSYCHFESKTTPDIVNHMQNLHGVRARVERPPGPHQCPQCPYEDSMRGKLTRHKVGCDKRFRGDRNQEPPHDWEPPAKIPKPSAQNRGIRPNVMGVGANPNYQTLAATMGLGGVTVNRSGPTYPSPNQNFGGAQNMQRNAFQGMPSLQMGARGRGRPVGTYKPGFPNQGFRQAVPNVGSSIGNRPLVGGSFINNQVLLQTANSQSSRYQSGSSSSASLLNNLGANSSVTIQSLSQRNNNPRSGQPSISITPLPGRTSQPSSRPSPTPQQSSPMGLKPGQPTTQGKDKYVVCEICDGYIKDLEQLRNHMQWIHKVKIHPKMIYNRPPLNCQKCQFRFFTDQGLERHLLGSHGLVTASMQDLANKGQDSGRCPICGKVYQWKLLNHVAKDHAKTLKPAHLSYKCTVCTATFGQYKLFETHVYTAHSGGNKKNLSLDKSGRSTPQQSPAASSGASKMAALKISDEITIIPQGKSLNAAFSNTKSPATKPEQNDSGKKGRSENDDDVIELDDDDEERAGSKRTKDSVTLKDGPEAKKAKASEADESEGEDVEEINDEDE